jgi:hypothetical protein
VEKKTRLFKGVPRNEATRREAAVRSSVVGYFAFLMGRCMDHSVQVNCTVNAVWRTRIVKEGKEKAIDFGN